jgi:hypothetical protein
VAVQIATVLVTYFAKPMSASIQGQLLQPAWQLWAGVGRELYQVSPVLCCAVLCCAVPCRSEALLKLLAGWLAGVGVWVCLLKSPLICCTSRAIME